MAEKEDAPPKVGPEVFAHDIRAGNERKVAAEKEKAPPKVGPEIFTQPKVLAGTDGQAVKKPVGSEVFSDKQLEGIVPDPITSPGAEKAPVRAGDTKGSKVTGAGDSKTAETSKPSAVKAQSKSAAKSAKATSAKAASPAAPSSTPSTSTTSSSATSAVKE